MKLSQLAITSLALAVSMLPVTTGEYLRDNYADRSLSYGGYVTVLHAGERLRRKQYLVEYDTYGKTKYKFGLDGEGTFGLWHYDELVWRPEGNSDGTTIRGDYLKFQESNGHMTLYFKYSDPPGPSYRLEHTFKTRCKDDDYKIGTRKIRKITLADGDVNQFDDAGAVVWALHGSRIKEGADPEMSVNPVCRPSRT